MVTIYLLDFYFLKLPKAHNTLDSFYLKPLQQVPKNSDAPWFHATPIGQNTLAKFVQMMCEEAGITEKKSNHSLRASRATAMFAANVPEKMIKEVTGHKSSKALAIYECLTVQQKQAVSNILVTSSKSCHAEVRKIEGTDHDRVAKKAPSIAPGQAIPNFMTFMFNTCISPQNFHVHMQPQVQAVHGHDHGFDEFDSLVESLPDY